MNKKEKNNKLPGWAIAIIIVSSVFYMVFLILFTLFIFAEEFDYDIKEDLIISSAVVMN
mgnify:CR=1 FL=1